MRFLCSESLDEEPNKLEKNCQTITIDTSQPDLDPDASCCFAVNDEAQCRVGEISGDETCEARPSWRNVMAA